MLQLGICTMKFWGRLPLACALGPRDTSPSRPVESQSSDETLTQKNLKTWGKSSPLLRALHRDQAPPLLSINL